MSVVESSRETLVNKILEEVQNKSNQYKLFNIIENLIATYEKTLATNILISASTPDKTTNSSVLHVDKPHKKPTANDFITECLSNDFKGPYGPFADYIIDLTADTIKNLSKDFSAKLKEEWAKQDDEFFEALAKTNNVFEFYNVLNNVFKTKVSQKSILSRLVVLINYDFETIMNSSGDTPLAAPTTPTPKKKKEPVHKKQIDNVEGRGLKYFQKYMKFINDKDHGCKFTTDNSELNKLINGVAAPNFLLKMNRAFKNINPAGVEKINKYFSQFDQFDFTPYPDAKDGKQAETMAILKILVENQEAIHDLFYEIFMVPDFAKGLNEPPGGVASPEDFIGLRDPESAPESAPESVPESAPEKPSATSGKIAFKSLKK